LASRGGINAAILAHILPQYEEVKGIGVSVSRRDKYRDFWNSMCTVPILQQLLQYKEMKKEAIFGIMIPTEFTIGVSRRDRNNAKLSLLLLQYKAAKGVGVGVSQRNTNNAKIQYSMCSYTCTDTVNDTIQIFSIPEV